MRSAILAVALFALPILFVGTSADDKTVSDPDWRWKADQALLRAYDAGVTPLEIGVQGAPVARPLDPPETRDAWNAYWAAEAAPFLGKLRGGASDVGATITNEFPAVNAVFLTVDRDAVPDLLSQPWIRRAGLDWEGAVTIDSTASSGPSILATLGETVPKVQAPDLWALGYKGAGIKLAGIDTGIRPTHEMMRNADGTSRVTQWYDATTPIESRCATTCDANGHGTHTITTAAGSNLYNAGSPIGVAPEAEIFGVRIFRGGGGQWEWALEGLQAAFDLGADVTTNSWGGGCSGLGITTAELAETLQNAGMYNVFAAGNSGTGGVACPGSVHNILTVGGIDVNDNLYGSSSRGPCTWPTGSSDTRVCPDVNAVAVDVVAGMHTSDTAYASLTGTSMATPHVAGVVVLLEQARRAVLGDGFSPADQDAEILLRYTAKDLGASGPDNDFGWGTAQALNAYNQMITTDTIALPNTLSIGSAEVRQSTTQTIGFAIANLGAVAVDGHLTTTVTQTSFGACPPDCFSATVFDEDIGLAPVREARRSTSLSGATLPAGDYSVVATYAYTYTDPIDGLLKSGLIEKTGTFVVKKVDMRWERLVPSFVGIGQPVLGGFVLTNVGNEEARGVSFTEKFRADGFAPLPAVPPGEGNNGVFANPAPNTATTPSTNPPTRQYRWTNIGTIDDNGGSWAASYNFLGGRPGDYLFDGSIFYRDEVGTFYTIEPDQMVTVGLPLP